MKPLSSSLLIRNRFILTFNELTIEISCIFYLICIFFALQKNEKQNKQCTSKSNSDCDRKTGSFLHFWPWSQSLVSKTRTLHEAMAPSTGENKNMRMFGEFCCFLIIISFNYPLSSRIRSSVKKKIERGCQVLKSIIRPQNINRVY